MSLRRSPWQVLSIGSARRPLLYELETEVSDPLSHLSRDRGAAARASGAKRISVLSRQRHDSAITTLVSERNGNVGLSRGTFAPSTQSAPAGRGTGELAPIRDGARAMAWGPSGTQGRFPFPWCDALWKYVARTGHATHFSSARIRCIMSSYRCIFSHSSLNSSPSPHSLAWRNLPRFSCSLLTSGTIR